MITRRYEVDNLIGVEINLGRAGENGSRTVEFDVRPWINLYPEGFVVVYVVPPMPHQPHHGLQHRPSTHGGYLALTTYKDGIVSWPITSNDTKTEGKGAVELILYGQDNEILQSTVVKTKISRSLSHNGHDCCHGVNPNQPWVDQMAKLAMAAQDAAERAEIAAEDLSNIVIENTIPDGGTKNQVLGKLSDQDRDIGWMDLPSVEGSMESMQEIINCPTRYDFPSIGDARMIYKAEYEGYLYQWNSRALKYERLNVPEISTDDITTIHGGDAYGTA